MDKESGGGDDVGCTNPTNELLPRFNQARDVLEVGCFVNVRISHRVKAAENVKG